MIPILTRIWTLISASGFMWKLIRNYSVLSGAFKSIEDVLLLMTKDGRALPNHMETQILCMAISNILKTEVIDIPGVDEYQIAIGLDNINQNMVLSIQDSKSGKFHQIPVLGAKK